MSQGPDPGQGTTTESGDGFLARAARATQWYLVTGVLMFVAVLPGMVPMQFLDSVPGNAPLLAFCVAPLAPAYSAGLYCLRDRTRPQATTAVRSFLRGYRQNWSDALRMAVPGLIYLALGGLGAGVFGDGGALAGDGVSILAAVPEFYLGLLLVIGLFVALWTMNAMAIVSFFSLRTREVVRLACSSLFVQWRVTFGGIVLLVIGLAVLIAAGDLVAAAISVLWTAAALWNHGSLIREVERRFTAADITREE